MYLYTWLIIAIILFATLSYMIGRENGSSEDVSGMFFTSFFAALAWPLLLAIALIIGPFYVPYKMGVNHRLKAAEQAKMWNTLKK